MDFFGLAEKRYSVREYLEEKVEDVKINAILEAGNIAPTACNNQPIKILVIKSEKGLAKLEKGSKTYGAPLAFIVCADHKASWRRSYDGKDSADIDASIVTSHMMLKAAELDLGSVWICSFEPSVIKEEFNIPENIEPVNILILGYAVNPLDIEERRNILKRKDLSDITVYESF